MATLRGCTCTGRDATLCPQCQVLLNRTHPIVTMPQAPKAPPRNQSLTSPYRSVTEARYAAYLAGEVNAGMVAQWYYEPCKGLRLGPTTSYTPDFLVVYCDGERGYEFHEVKGAFIREKDWIKAKIAAAIFPCFRFVLAQWEDERWHWKEIPSR